MPLETIEIETAPQPDCRRDLAAWTRRGWARFRAVVPEIVRRGERAWRFVFPHAPVRPGDDQRRHEHARVVRHPGFGSERRARMRRDFAAPMRRCGELIEHGRLRAEFRPAESCSRASRKAARCRCIPRLRYPERLAGVMALSCYLPLAGTLAAERAPAKTGPPIFMAHGLSDPMLPHRDGPRVARFAEEPGLRGRVASVSHGAFGLLRRKSPTFATSCFACLPLELTARRILILDTPRDRTPGPG